MFLEHCGEDLKKDDKPAPRVLTDGVGALVIDEAIADEFKPKYMLPRGAYLNLDQMEQARQQLHAEIKREEAKLAKLDEQPSVAKLKLKVVRLGRQHRKGLRTITLTTVLPKGKRVRRNFIAGPGQAWTEGGLEDLLDQYADTLAQKFPGVEFRLVEVKHSEQFNFIHADAEKQSDVRSCGPNKAEENPGEAVA